MQCDVKGELSGIYDSLISNLVPDQPALQRAWYLRREDPHWAPEDELPSNPANMLDAIKAAFPDTLIRLGGTCMSSYVRYKAVGRAHIAMKPSHFAGTSTGSIDLPLGSIDDHDHIISLDWSNIHLPPYGWGTDVISRIVQCFNGYSSQRTMIEIF